MHETLVLILTQIRMIWRFRWISLATAIVLCVLGWGVVAILPNQYEVEAKVFLDTSSMLKPLLRGLAVDSRAEQDASLMMRRTLLVRPNLEIVARKTDMDLTTRTPEEFERLLAELALRIKVSGTGQDNIFVIAYKNADPKLATRVVEAILNLFVERSLGETRKDAGKTTEFLDQQIAEYESRLTAAENRLKDFKRKNVGLMPREGINYFARLGAMQEQLADAKLQLDEASRRRDEYQRQLEGAEPLALLQRAPAPAGPHPLDERIAGLESRLDQLLLQYTEKHPDVIAIRSMIAAMQAERSGTPVPAPVAEGASSDVQNAKVLKQEVSIALGQVEAEVAGLQARVAEFERRAQELRDLVDTVPRIEAELSRLNRDHGINKHNYDELVKRRESLALSEQVSQSNDTVKFNVIEPPRVPLIPTGPNRPLLSAVVLVLGLGGGLGCAWLMAVVRPAVYRREEIGLAFQLPVLGTVSRSWTRAETFRRRADVSSFFVGCLLLIGLFSTVIFVELMHDDFLNRFRDGMMSLKVGDMVSRYL